MAAIETFLEIEPIDLSNTCLKKDSLKGDVAVVTGSTSNVGLGYVRAIAWAGGKVVVSGNNEKAGAEIERVINAENAPGTAIFVKCDVKKESDVKNLAKRAFEAFGKVDILINNAMKLNLNGSVLESPVSEFEESFAISGIGTMLTIKEFVPGMLERKHGAVAYSTTQFHFSPPMFGGAMYTAGKAAATSITMSLANEVSPYEENGVGVFCMIPSFVESSATARAHGSKDGKDNSETTFTVRNGFGGPISPEANGAAMVYCILNAGKVHRSGFSNTDAFHAMKYPYPYPDTVQNVEMRRLTDNELTLVFKNMGSCFAE